MNKPQILVVEDDTAVGNLITTTLETQNYLFHRAKNRRGRSDGRPVLPPDVILLDLGLPDMGGVTLIQKIRSWSNLPITGHLRPQRGQRQGLRPGRRRR